jgi:hypothetical protein
MVVFFAKGGEIRKEISKFQSFLGHWHGFEYFLYAQKSIVKKCNCTVYLLTSWSRVILEKLIRSELVKKFPTF